MVDLSAPLRQLGDWRPQSILKKLGSAKSPDEELGLLIVALGVLHGPPRVRDLVVRIEIELRRIAPRLEVIAAEPSLAKARPLIDALVQRGRPLIADLPKLKARAANETKPNPVVGLVIGDLLAIAALVRTVAMGSELTAKPSPAGIDRARRQFDASPPIALVRTWVKRLLPDLAASAMIGVDPAFGRVVLVHEDGRLAYDAAAMPEA
ncbi:MAG: hypothetical protein U1E65_25220 [Myxococcota bacterium]